MKWDTGAVGLLYSATPGLNFWLANDFDVATLAAYNVVYMRTMAWWGNNGQWDGFRVALYSFPGQPDSIIWPTSGTPLFVMPSGAGPWRWVDVNIGWNLPGGTSAFVVAHEQFYSPPNYDGYCLDNSTVSAGHSWRYSSSGGWVHFSVGGRNAMLRVVVANYPAVEPASLGRVKALYW